MTHAACFPRYRVTKPPERELAGIVGRSVVNEQGEVCCEAEWPFIKTYLEGTPALVLSPPVATQRWLLDAARDQEATVLVAESGGIGGVRTVNRRDKRRAGWIIPISSWLPQQHVDPAALRAIRQACSLCGVGVASTPSALGLAMMRRYWQGRPLYRPNRAIWQTLHDNIHGGRVDTLQPGKRFKLAYGEDMSSAYPWAAQCIPGGTAYGFEGTPPADAATYFQDCAIDLGREDSGRALGPLPFRNRWYETEYPTYGPVWGWWWKEEIEDALAAGAMVVGRGRGYAWPILACSLAPWSQNVYGLRAQCISAEVAGIVKLASVAGIGRMGMGWETRRLVPYESGMERWQGEDNYGIVTEERENECMLIHVASYIHMSVRRALYHRSVGFAERGQLISTNFDEILYTGGALDGCENGVLGGWKHSAYRNLIVRHPRWKEGDIWNDGRWERISRRPGVKKERESWQSLG